MILITALQCQLIFNLEIVTFSAGLFSSILSAFSSSASALNDVQYLQELLGQIVKTCNFAIKVASQMENLAIHMVYESSVLSDMTKKYIYISQTFLQ